MSYVKYCLHDYPAYYCFVRLVKLLPKEYRCEVNGWAQDHNCYLSDGLFCFQTEAEYMAFYLSWCTVNHPIIEAS